MHLNLYRNTNLSSRHSKPNPGDKLLGSIRFAAQDSNALRKAAEVTRGEAQPAARGPCIRGLAIKSDCVQLGHPVGRRRANTPCQERLVFALCCWFDLFRARHKV